MNSPAEPSRIAGVDLGDASSVVVLLDAASGTVLERVTVATTRVAFRRYFDSQERMQVVLETGTHSPWVGREIEACGHEVVIANARQLPIVYAARRKTDQVDGEKLARLARVDLRLLAPVASRTLQAQQDLALLRSRGALVRTRTLLINHVRGSVKSLGYRLPRCATETFHQRARDKIPPELAPALQPLLDAIAAINVQIKELRKRIGHLAKQTYPQTALLTQVPGVGDVTALTFVLTVAEPLRFAKSRCIGAYFGLAPGRRQSGASDPPRRITKEGNEDVRRLLVQCAHVILRPNSPDTDLKRHGQKLAAPGTKRAKHTAVVAVARKLAVLLHALWTTGEVYDPHRQANRFRAATATTA